ncbi:doublesex- and mab-3-related transcription factor B1-like [Puntigrus tetrazona]|uniref:doublesex- and mab-3-related transcription factor B1-like n=1 Tax=Puntigrus tetrazona TaxID=1606681 RepID=UPI001C89FF90|nr:doublesex- and mab-3-related transcription factor B1-like [Puntigrus tetrazona]
MANIPAATANNGLAAERAARSPKCSRCRNHGFVVQLKGHSGKCRFKRCLCWKCSLINERTRILASQRRIRAERPERTALSGRKSVSAGNGNLTDEVNAQTDASARKKSNARPPADDKSYVELHAPLSTCCPDSAGNRDPETAAGPSAQNFAVEGAPPFSGEYMVKEAVPGPIYPAEMFAMPLPMCQHYLDRYMLPAVFVTLRPPAPGAFREHVGFVPLPEGPLSHPLETPEWQIHVPHYSPCATYPGVRDEPSQHSQSNMD